MPKIASIRISQLQRTFDNADILMMLILLFSLLNFCGILYSVTVLLFGFIMPCYCRSQDIYVSQYYFEVLAFLLWLRLWDNRFTTLDVLLYQLMQAFIIVSLWHPNFRIAEKAVRWLK